MRLSLILRRFIIELKVAGYCKILKLKLLIFSS